MGYLQRLFAATEEMNRRAILDLLPAGVGGALLDLGANRGEFTERLGRHLGAERVVGVELLEEHANAARARGLEVVAGDLDAGVPLESESFDWVHANQVIEHVRRTDAFLAEARRLLRPGGTLVISTNNLASWHNVASLALGFQPMPAHASDEVIVGNPLNPEAGQPHEDLGRTHLRLFTAPALVELAEHHGLSAAHIGTVGYYPLPPRAARLANRLDPRHGAFLTGSFTRTGAPAPAAP